jgi:phosphoserine aminotransferase
VKELNFYPGPSKLYSKVSSYTHDAFESHVLERNHRSETFMEMMRNTIEDFKFKMNIPQDYKVFFTSSATECWEITAQSLFYGKVQFLYNGAFGKKWFKYAVTNPQINNSILNFEIRGSRFFLNQEACDLELDDNNNVICLVAAETSNGTEIKNNTLEIIREKQKETLIVVDATATLGGVAHDFSKADVWFASVQKCLGLPSGMAVMVVSPRALSISNQINERNHYNSMVFIQENFEKYQTHYTPNILGIYLLGRLMIDIEPIQIISENLATRAAQIYDFIGSVEGLEAMVENPKTRSNTVVCIKSFNIEKIKTEAKNRGIILGNGYGEWKNDTFRIANFPAIPDQDFLDLFSFFKNIL